MANIDKPELDELDPLELGEDLEPELTAQPRLMTDALASTEPELSQDPEDLGAHFLSEAVEQGDIPTEPVEDASATSLEEEVTEVRGDSGARASTLREYVTPDEAPEERTSYTRLTAEPTPERGIAAGARSVLRRSANLLRKLADRLDSNVA